MKPPIIPVPTRQSQKLLHEQMIINEQHYQRALKNDEAFSVLKGFKNAMKRLKAKLEKNPLTDLR
jgi:hypothetical protein